MSDERDPGTIRMVNCAGPNCGKTLLGESEAEWAATARGHLNLPPLCAGRRLGRPFCGECLGVVDFQAGERRRAAGGVSQ